VSAGFGLRPGRDRSADIEAYAAAYGGRVGLPAVLDDLDRQARRGYGAFGLRVSRALTWDAEDRRTHRWWPQGISSSADARLDASASDSYCGRRLLAVSWYAKQRGAKAGSRISFLDLDTRRYRHVELGRVVVDDGRPRLEPLRVHAGGLVWHGPWLLVAATAKGVWAAHLDDVIRVPAQTHVLPVRQAWAATTDEGVEPFRYSFLSLTRRGSANLLLAGEYARGRRPRRLVHYALEPTTGLPVLSTEGAARPVDELLTGVRGMQGAVEVDGRWHCSVSHGPWTPGSVYAGRPGALRRSRWATPIGPEDLTWWPEQGRLWTASEHPRRRWVNALRPASR
jgi:hypothetical protein